VNFTEGVGIWRRWESVFYHPLGDPGEK